MKAKIHRASAYEKYWIEEIISLKDLLRLIDKFGRIIVYRNYSYHSKPYPNRKMWEEEEALGLHECPIEVIIYDDYIE